MKRVGRSIHILLLLAGGWFLGSMTVLNTPILAEDIIIIVNKSVYNESLSVLDVKNIFLGKKKVWDNNEKIVLAVLKKDNTHKKFTRKYLKKNSTQFNNYWKNMVFTGKARAPRRFKDEEELRGFVAGTQDAIGYISSELYTKDVKKIIVYGME